MPRMRRLLSARFFRSSAGCFILAILPLAARPASAAPFTTATVTKVENKVLLGERSATGSITRMAAEKDVLEARNFLRTENSSLAELRYPDGAVMRISENSVFSFDAGTRTVTNDHGSFLFYFPKGTGGAVIKTASLTAAIADPNSATAGKASDMAILIVVGE